MLKVTLTLKANIRLKNSNARVTQSLKRLYWLYFVFFKLNTCNTVGGIKTSSFLKFKLRSGCMVLMRSPFHYKVSKTILTVPKQTLHLIIHIPYQVNCPIFFNKNLLLFFHNFNKIDAIQVVNIKIAHSMLNFRRLHTQPKHIQNGFIHGILLQLRVECACCMIKPYPLQYSIKNKLY